GASSDRGGGRRQELCDGRARRRPSPQDRLGPRPDAPFPRLVVKNAARSPDFAGGQRNVIAFSTPHSRGSGNPGVADRGPGSPLSRGRAEKNSWSEILPPNVGLFSCKQQEKNRPPRSWCRIYGPFCAMLAPKNRTITGQEQESRHASAAAAAA